MKTYTHRQYVEQFHLLFLAQLGRKLDKKVYALKGGCNLRFFFRSLRYSEDMDLDAGEVPVHVLREKVAGILSSTPFRQILEVRDIAIEHVTEHKQTETTQRWKLGLLVPRTDTPLATKIEFSRRGMSDRVKFESVDPTLIRSYELSPVMVNHYPRDVAFKQKVEALATRSAPQARDAYDLHLLLSSGARPDLQSEELGPGLIKARASVLSMSFETFKSQVVAYLTPEDQAQYDSEEVWDNMRLEVMESLDREAP